MMSSDALLTLRRVNDNLRSALEHFRPGQTYSSKITASDFSDLLADLLRAGECLRNLKANYSDSVPPNSGDAQALEQETNAYRGNLEKLKHSLPDLHARLLAEKARLQFAQKHVAAAAAWARASGKTL